MSRIQVRQSKNYDNIRVIGNSNFTFDTIDCDLTFKRFRSIYSNHFLISDYCIYYPSYDKRLFIYIYLFIYLFIYLYIYNPY